MSALARPMPPATDRLAAAAPRRVWSRVWRYLAAAGIGLLAWVFAAVDLLPSGPETVPVEVEEAVGSFLLLDLLLGAVAMCLLPLRHRFPELTAAITATLSAAATSASGPSALAAVSMSSRRRWRGICVIAVVWLAAGVCYELVVRRSVPGVDVDLPTSSTVLAIAMAGYAVCVAVGLSIAARREQLVSLRERAETAEREQALKAESARVAERTRIAREMHDVLAHRISLVALHAGALAYRSDLTPQETAQAAAVIQDNATRALAELRQVLGVLRADGTAGGPESPQPTLADLDGLLADAEDAGTEVRLEVADHARLADVPVTVSRTAYRVVQEALTNARKHAPGAVVDLHLAAGSADGLTVLVRNGGARADRSVPGAGMGLTGLAERVELVGGRLTWQVTPDGAFELRAWMPWRGEP